MKRWRHLSLDEETAQEIEALGKSEFNEQTLVGQIRVMKEFYKTWKPKVEHLSIQTATATTTAATTPKVRV